MAHLKTTFENVFIPLIDEDICVIGYYLHFWIFFLPHCNTVTIVFQDFMLKQEVLAFDDYKVIMEEDINSDGKHLINITAAM